MLLLGNAAALIGCVIMVGIGLVKKKEHILAVQCVQFTFMGLGNLLLGASAGFISNLVSIVRNLTFSRFANPLRAKILFIVVQVGLTLLSVGTGLVDWLPVMTVVVYTWCLDMKNAAAFKLMMIGTSLLWAVYDLHYLNYVAFTFDLLTVASTALGILRIQKEKR